MTKVTQPLFKYPGSKWQLSKYYPAPSYGLVIEPFAGSACYALRHARLNVLLTDTDPEVIALWRYLINVEGSEIAALPVNLEVGYDIRNLDISDGAKLLIRARQRVGTSTCWTVSKWGNLPGQWTKSARDAAARNVECIRHWRVACQHYMYNPDWPATWFIDPPYQSLPLFNSKAIRYPALASWCRTRKGQVIVCEREQSERWLPFVPFRDICNGRRKRSQEVIWTQGFDS